MRISAKADYAVRAAVALAAAGGERPTKGDTIARGLVGFGHNSESALRQWTKWDIDAASGPRDRRRRPPR